jgi:riboflavin biosynthesis pyrimidine reductase
VSEPELHLECLFEAPGLPRLSLPEEIEAIYGGSFGLPQRSVFGNFVTSIDGVAALAGVRMSSAVISGAAPSDRFVMALLRSVADCVMVGAATLREHTGPWTAERAFPDAAELFRRVRQLISAPDHPTLVIVTGSGELPPDHPALEEAIVLTTSPGARRIADGRVRCGEVVELGSGGEVDVRSAVDVLRHRGYGRILTEGGPRLIGSMLRAAVVDELFLTVAPKLIGGGSDRPPLSGDADLLDVGAVRLLLSARRGGDYLFLRYALRLGASPAAP